MKITISILEVAEGLKAGIGKEGNPMEPLESMVTLAADMGLAALETIDFDVLGAIRADIRDRIGAR